LSRIIAEVMGDGVIDIDVDIEIEVDVKNAQLLENEAVED
jgi:hypothetical protein